MERKKLRILAVDRPLRPGEHPMVDIFNVYREKDFDIVIFPWREDKTRTEVIVFDYAVFSSIEHLFCLSDTKEEDEPLYDFDLEDVTEETFYDILDQEFEVEASNLSEVERRNG